MYKTEICDQNAICGKPNRSYRRKVRNYDK